MVIAGVVLKSPPYTKNNNSNDGHCARCSGGIRGRPAGAAGSGTFPARELSVQERVSSADSSLVHFLVKTRQIKRVDRDL